MKYQAILIALIIVISISLGGATLSKSGVPQPKNNTASGVSFIKDLSGVIAEKAVQAVDGVGNLTAQVGNTGKSLGQKVAYSGSYVVGKTAGFFENLGSEAAQSETSKIEASASSSVSQNQSPLLSAQSKINYSPTVSCNVDASKIKSKAALIRYLDYDRDILNLNTDERWPIASVSKLMTSVVAVETFGWDAQVSVSQKAVDTEGIAGSLQPGEIYTVRDLIKAMLITSSNDAAVAVSEAGGEKEFIDSMQKKARELKMLQTTYLEPTGLSFVNQSTANDLAKLVNYINQNHLELFKISRMREAQITDLKLGRTKTLLNIDKFAGNIDFLGGKTGYIDESGRNLVGLFNIDGRRVMTIVLGSNDSFTETDKLKAIVSGCE